MKKFHFLAAVLGFAVAAQAQMPFSAVGYDDNLRHVTARLALSENNAVDLGVGIIYDDAAATDAFQLGLSGYYLLKLQDWGVVDNHLALGGNANILSDSDFELTLFAGLQPEVTLLDRLILSTRFGAELHILPDVGLNTAGQGISIVSGVNFKIIW